ncbi:hypothetical protein NQ318_023499 [Aromia moschata]|uniref:Uncharacterized protein n=1 Tax=Aromia moschata TaxID=1265417 RepID=A0AAV8YR07_9CUCU|nr:hypothetical protein NQ318_023499 [Aromia moschata]
MEQRIKPQTRCNKIKANKCNKIYRERALEGEAQQVTHLVDFSADNYSVIWELLCDRYDNKSLLVNDHLKLLFGLPTQQKESALDLRNMLDSVTKHLHAFEKLGINIESWDPIIIIGELEEENLYTEYIDTAAKTSVAGRHLYECLRQVPTVIFRRRQATVTLVDGLSQVQDILTTTVTDRASVTVSVED